MNLQKQIALQNDRIEIRFPYSEGLVQRVKQIPDVMWDNNDKCWFTRPTFYYAEHAHKLANEYQFMITDGVYQIIRGGKPHTERLGLYNYQKEAVDFIERNYGTCLLAEDMGCGKTIEALAYIKEQDLQRTLVICPASVLYKWQDEITKWCGWDSQVVLTGKMPLDHDKRVLIMSYAIMVKRVYELRDIEFDMIIADEAHYIVSPKAKRSVAYGMLTGKRKLFLSGTPFLNRPIELFNILHHINPIRWQSYWGYAQRYAGASKKTIWTKGGQRAVWDVNGATNLEELKENIAPIVLRRTKREVLTELPELVRTKISIDISNKREYNHAKLDLKNWMKANGKDGTVNALSKLNVLRQIIGKGKVDAAVELAEEVLLNPDRKVVLYAHHREVVDMLKEALLSYGVDTIVGDDSNMRRADTINRFQNMALPRVLVVSSAAAEGIDLYRADTMIVVEREWNAGKESQAEGRLHRNGQKNSVQVYYLVGRDTIDVDIDELIIHKSDIFDTLIGSDDIRVEVLNRLK